MKKSKNSRTRPSWQYKTVGDRKVQPALFDGKRVGMGKYLAAQDGGTGELITVDGVPIPYKDIK